MVLPVWVEGCEVDLVSLALHDELCEGLPCGGALREGWSVQLCEFKSDDSVWSSHQWLRRSPAHL